MGLGKTIQTISFLYTLVKEVREGGREGWRERGREGGGREGGREEGREGGRVVNGKKERIENY